MSSNESNFQSNSSSENEGSVSIHGLVELFCFVIPAFILCLSVMIFILCSNSLPKPVRIVLINILTASCTVCFGLTVLNLSEIIITSSKSLSQNDATCRLVYWIVFSGGAMRLAGMSIYAVTVYIIVKIGVAGIKLHFFVPAIVFIWIVTLIFNTSLFSPTIVEFGTMKSYICSLKSYGSPPIAYFSMYTILYFITTYCITLIVPILTLLYVRKNRCSKDVGFHKTLAKFDLFLLIGNTLGICALILPLTSAVFPPRNEREIAKYQVGIIISQRIIMALSLIPTPLIIVFYFKPVRQKVVAVLKAYKYISETTTHS